MVIGRSFAGPVVHCLAPQGVLLLSDIFAAIIFGVGVCYFWTTMIGFLAENIPKSGALCLNLIGGEALTII